jgi:hypothetical protein
MQDKKLDEDMNEVERNTWLPFKRIFVQNHWKQYEFENPISGVTH